MSTDGGKWGDLPARTMSAAVLLVVGALGIWLGGLWFRLLVAVLGGGMIWELSRIMGAKTSVANSLGVVAGIALMAVPLLPGQAVLPVLLGVALAGAGQVPKDRWIYGVYAAGLMLACFVLAAVREARGPEWVLWLVAVVVATDVAGYFAGRLIGGPKFWPKVSPKKTWSGTIAGWVAAAIVGLAFGGGSAVMLSVLTSFASQMGDASESAIKRRAGIKDSSNLIPGHGGLLDRFDAMMAAALFMGLYWAVLGLPPG